MGLEGFLFSKKEMNSIFTVPSTFIKYKASFAKHG